MSGASAARMLRRQAAAAGDEAAAEPAALRLPADLKSDLLGELAAWAAGVRVPSERAELARLAAAIAAGAVPPVLQDALARLLDLSVATGRVRRLHGAAVERAFAALHAETPAGRELARRARETEAVLEALRGAVLSGITVSCRQPGTVRLEIATERARLALDVERGVVSIESLAVEF